MDGYNDFIPLQLTSTDKLPQLAITSLSSWGAITILGDEKKSYLQGQITCDVVTLDKQATTLGAHCDAKGKVWSVFRLFHHNDGYAMFQPKSVIEKELAELKKYAIFSKVEISQSQDVALGVMGESATEFIDALCPQEGNVRQLEGGTAVKIDTYRWLLLLETAKAESILQASSAPKVDQALWMLFDIKAGFPVLTAEQQNEHIPQALNLQALGGISFSKGCYTGQETVARAKYRGMNKRALFIIKTEQGDENKITDDKIENDAKLERSVGENWRSAGKLLTSYQYSNGQAIALVVLPNNLEAETKLRLKNQPNTLWTLAKLPYLLDE